MTRDKEGARGGAGAQTADTEARGRQPTPGDAAPQDVRAPRGSRRAPRHLTRARAWSASRTLVHTLAVLLGIGLVVATWRLREPLAVLFAAILFASAIRPAVEALCRRRVPQPVAILSMFALVLGGVVSLILFAAPGFVVLVQDIAESGVVLRASRFLSAQLTWLGWDVFGVAVPRPDLPTQVAALMGDAGREARRQAWPTARLIGGYATNAGIGLVMAFYWLTSRESILTLALGLSPPRQRERVRTVWTDVEHTLGAYVRAQAILMLTIGVASYLGLLVLGVPYALQLAIIAGLTELIPMLGPVIGALPAILVGWMVSPGTGLAVAGWYVVIQQLEGSLLVPKVMHRSIGLDPLLVIFALFAGGLLAGPIGALLAIPLAGAVQVIMRHLWIEPVLNHNDVVACPEDLSEPGSTAAHAPASDLPAGPQIIGTES